MHELKLPPLEGLHSGSGAGSACFLPQVTYLLQSLPHLGPGEHHVFACHPWLIPKGHMFPLAFARLSYSSAVPQMETPACAGTRLLFQSRSPMHIYISLSQGKGYPIRFRLPSDETDEGTTFFNPIISPIRGSSIFSPCYSFVCKYLSFGCGLVPAPPAFCSLR